MRIQVVLLALLALPSFARAQESITYRLQYAGDGATVHVSVVLSAGISGAVTLVMPRTVPGGYSWRLYDNFVEEVRAFSPVGTPVSMKRAEMGPRWNAGGS